MTSDNPKRGFAGDADDALKKAQELNELLEYISSFAPSFLSTDIQKNSTSIESVWKFIREYYRFERSEIQFMKLLAITQEENERPQRLYQRVLAHLQDNLLTKDSKMQHNGKPYDKTEDMSPTVERLAVLRWMELIHPKIPVLVMRTFATDLQKYTLKDLQPRIADAIDGFMEEIRLEDCQADRVKSKVNRAQAQVYDDSDEEEFEEEVSAARAFTRPRTKQKQISTYQSSHTQQPSQYKKANKYCLVCKIAKKPFNHSRSECEVLRAIRSLKV